MYGLYLAISALALHIYARIHDKRRLSAALLVLNALVHAALVHTHLFGVFYSGAILAAFFVTDRLFKVFRPWLYLSVVVAWASLLLYLPAFRVQADAGHPRTWIPAPDLVDLLDIYNLTAQSFASRTLLLVLGLLLAYFFYRATDKDTYFDRYRIQKAEVPLLVFGGMLFITPVFVWVISLTIKPVFYPRYMIPSAIGWAILVVFIASRNLPLGWPRQYRKDSTPAEAPDKRLLWAFVLLCLVRPIGASIKFHGKPSPGSHDLSAAVLAKYGGLPRVVTLSGDFLERAYYSPRRNQYFYILDWKSAVDINSGTFPPQEYKHMDAWKRNFPQLFKNNILSSGEFLQRYDRFLVLDRPNYLAKCQQNHRGLHTLNLWDDYLDCPQWVEMRLLTNPNYNVTFIKNYKWFALLLVERKRRQPPSSSQ